ncbi:MAG: hypothetical protein DCC52_12385, partial [Chloroflexi bacterium]
MTRTNGTLQKHYDKLAARERMALLLGAIARGDDRERAALLESAPRVLYRLPHHHNAFIGFTFAQMMYLIHQLHRAWTMATMAHLANTNDDAWRGAGIAAYALCVQADAWRAFCGELGIDENAMIAGFAEALQSLAFAERIARVFAFTFEETRAELAKMFGEDLEPITVERALADLR